MSYSSNSRPKHARGLQGFVSYSSIMALQLGSHWYAALIEVYNTSTQTRSYYWSDARYLSFWDMNSWDSSLNKTVSGAVRQAPMMYYWNGSSWIQLTDDTAAM